MSEGISPVESTEREHMSLPFRMGDVTLNRPVPDSVPGADVMNKLLIEWMFQFKLLTAEWNKSHYTTLVFGFIAFILGSVSTELFDGGDATVTGVNGVLAINGFQFFQILISVLFWTWFAFQAWNLFPVMRVHAISLLAMWNGLVFAQVFFHSNNGSFPIGAQLSNMMEGTLIVLVVLFFVFFFWKAVIETRDLHVEIHHLHEDVRVMEAEMAEHSLAGWTALFASWIALVLISSWAGVHHIATLGDSQTMFLVLHLITGIASLPLLFIVLWYPQRMLGDDANVRTKAALDASLELEGPSTHAMQTDSKCPECGSKSPLHRLDNGSVAHPCLSSGCTAQVVIGESCPSCKTKMSSRLQCSSCGVNAPALDYFPDQEEW